MIVRDMRSNLDLAPFQFHISRDARRRYGFEETLFAFDGNAILADLAAARRFAARLNAVRGPSDAPVTPGQVYAMGLIDEVLHAVIETHRREARPSLLRDALERLEGELGGDEVDRLLLAFVDRFPPPAVDRGELTPAVWLAGATGGLSHREAALEELLLLRLANQNPAFEPFEELFDDEALVSGTAYLPALESFESLLDDEPSPLSGHRSLLTMLRAPMLAAPGSLDGQLRFVRSRWAELLGPAVLRLLSSLDILAEEFREIGTFVPGQVEVPVYPSRWREEPEGDAPEAYSPDLDWMPRVVLLAKNVHVWLAQLERQYGREIRRLDQIPDAELDRIAARGFTALWLIGVWERSRASERIKRRMGDTEAVASAYSLQDYVVAAELGGNAAFDDLKRRAWERRIRMSTDMVPNHVGIDSRWVVEHPDWFVQRRDCPFPSYTFGGPDLSDDDRVGIFLEDHYYDRTDAAVVFRRVDRWTGDERFLYHGNDGTSMPWNDTAQLDYRNPEVREAVIQTILHVARQSPIIRFDAAMTLTKKHFQRLWFPQPGTGGDIPSRAEFGMTRDEFDRTMPTEFWREVVDRVAQEAPDTLLLAEAFWLLEGYFVRTLGMHRVYNSAFMNMLRDERNADYRQLIRNTLEYDPQILKRYVNFMSNPDERTAVDQFGTHDKYFGVATLMATMPGLPMFGHGQVEGYAEKYGMEFRRPRWDEHPNEGLVRRHELQLFPLLHRRWQFAEVERFRLFDFEALGGGVDENVFAYSNDVMGARSLVVYHNRFGRTVGRVLHATGFAIRREDGSVAVEGGTLGEALGLPRDPRAWLVLHDAARGLETLHSCEALHRDGLPLELEAYELRAFVDLRELWDDDRGRVRELAGRLGGRAVPSVETALREMDLGDVLEPYERLLAPARIEALVAVAAGGETVQDATGERAEPDAEPAAGDAGDGEPEPETPPPDDAAEAADPIPEDLGDLLASLRQDAQELLEAAAKRAGTEVSPADADAVADEVESLLSLPLMWRAADAGRPAPAEALQDALGRRADRWAVVLAWALTRSLEAVAPEVDDDAGAADRVRLWLDEWLLGSRLAAALGTLGCADEVGARGLDLVRILLLLEGRLMAATTPQDAAREVAGLLLSSPEGRRLAGVNRYDGVTWLHRESFLELVEWLRVATLAVGSASHNDSLVAALEEVERRLGEALERSDFRVEGLLAALEPAAVASDEDEAPELAGGAGDGGDDAPAEPAGADGADDER